MQAQSRPPGVAYGECWCGCGDQARRAKVNDRRSGVMKGEPYRFMKGHGARMAPRYEVRDMGHDTPCWVWTGKSMTKGGYAVITRNGKQTTAHRWMYEQEVGPVPRGFHVDHLCRVRACIRPDHLEAVTPSENARRGLKTKLTSEQVREIRNTPKIYGSGRALARRFGVGQDVICDIRNGYHRPDD
jgi:hypothetical protein